MNNSKQVIVMRKSFVIDGKKVTPRKGKYIAQGAHASLKAILDSGEIDNDVFRLYMLDDESALKDWINGSFTKVCCVVETEEELLSVYNKAKEKGLISSLITDSGLTEFGGVPTITCCAIGPAWSDELEEITGKLELF
jgi:PTH2 family peptidyl-tRNA hydrolase